MNPRDLPEVVAKLSIEMPEVRSEINALNGRVDRLKRTVVTGFRELHEEQRGMREDIQALPEQLSTAMLKPLKPFLLKILDNSAQLKSHDARLNRLEKSE